MKTFLLSAIAGLSIFASSAFAFPTASEMAANFKTCQSSDESWNSRWGQYIVAFDIDEATQICRSQLPPQMPTVTGCEGADGSWLYAGYYCRDILLQ